MERKKALLSVIGGRGTPDVLALLCVRPHLLAILTSEEDSRDRQSIINIACCLPQHETLLPVVKVKSYEMKDIMQACNDICKDYPPTEWDWTFSIGSCPKIMGIAAYEIAREMQIPCIYINTSPEKIVSLVKNIGISETELFHMSVKDYIKIYQREPESYEPETLIYRKTIESWGHIARMMALSSDTTYFVKLMRDKKEHELASLSSDLAPTSSLLHDLEECGAIEIKSRSDGSTTCEFTTPHFSNFLRTGDWLELYSWHEANELSFADDIQWGYKIKSTADNELDVMLTYKAQLIVAECKTSEKPFKTTLLDSLNAKADMLGGQYVTKIFVTCASKMQTSYDNFAEQAKLRKIIVVTGEDLANIGAILKREALTPTYPRI